MPKKNRISKTLNRKLKDLEAHLHFLKESLAKLATGDNAYIKSLAAELRVLVCESSRTEGLLWRLIDEMHLSDDVHVHLAGNVDHNHSLSKGLDFLFIPIFRAGYGDPKLPSAQYSLKMIIKECEAIVVAGEGHSHEKLIRNVAEQMGSAHEDDGVEPHLVELEGTVISNQVALDMVLMSEADLVLEIGERVLAMAKQNIGFERTSRPRVVMPDLKIKYDSDAKHMDFEGNDNALPSEGSIVFQINHPHPDWCTNKDVYDFGLLKKGPLSIHLIKHSDKSMEISIDGLAGAVITTRKLIPTGTRPGVMVAFTWKTGEIVFYLNGEYVDTIQYQKHD
ncbi:MAG: hypothetical protein WC515_08070 [Candidatus Omnitrophota bacterium]